MSRVNPYGSIQKRTFENALLYHLETQWGLLGGRRILQLLVDDVVELRDEFYPATENVGSGTLVCPPCLPQAGQGTCTADEGCKAD